MPPSSPASVRVMSHSASNVELAGVMRLTCQVRVMILLTCQIDIIHPKHLQDLYAPLLPGFGACNDAFRLKGACNDAFHLKGACNDAFHLSGACNDALQGLCNDVNNSRISFSSSSPPAPASERVMMHLT